ncbi:MAG: site-specific integrase [Devosia marina]|uniref:site-specific integrase n=1 Tax=Devosia marina TaxID=2683198 RepID=UPI0032EE32E8
MNHIEADFLLKSRDAFLSSASLTLQDLRDRVAGGAEGTDRRDTLSALDTVARAFARDLATIKADAATVRTLLASGTAAQLGLSDKRYANVRSAIVGAVRRFGEPIVPVTRRIAFADSWRDLLNLVETRHHRFGLHRLACFCSVMGIEADQVDRETLLGLHEALEAEELVKQPRRLLKHTIALWNICRRTVSDWPNITLASPFEHDIIALPITAFPESFVEDLGCWQRRVSKVDPFDNDAPRRALRQTTINNQTAILIRIASALVRSGTVELQDVTSLAVLVEVEHFKTALRFIVARQPDGEPTPYIHRMANILRYVAIHYCDVDEAQQSDLTDLCERLDPRQPRQMSSRNRERLRQFDDPEAVLRLLNFPEAEAERGLAQTNLLRAAKCFERALAVSMLIHCTLRIGNLRTINMETDLRRVGRTWYLNIDGDRVKNGQPLDFELPEALTRLLQTYVRDHRPQLPGATGPYLFPGRDGGPRPHSTMRIDISDALRKRAGLVMNPHLFRHAIAKIVIERDPGLAFSISRQLGHKRMDMTMQHYLGTEGRSAGRQINRLLNKALADPIVPED